MQVARLLPLRDIYSEGEHADHLGFENFHFSARRHKWGAERSDQPCDVRTTQQPPGTGKVKLTISKVSPLNAILDQPRDQNA